MRLFSLGLSFTVSVGAVTACSGSNGGSSAANGTDGWSKFTCGTKAASPSTCPQSELDKRSACISSQCNSEYTACHGPDYKNGTFGGPCADFDNCVVSCNCDTNCAQTCASKLTPSCQTCTKMASTCVADKCPLQCGTSGDSGTGQPTGRDSGTGSRPQGCVDLDACCSSSMMDAYPKDRTDCQIMSKSNLEVACVAYHDDLRKRNRCP